MCASASRRSKSLDPADSASVCLALAQAFLDDPFYRAVTIESAIDEVRRQWVLARYFELAIAEGSVIGEVRYAGTDGAAIWITSKASDAEVALQGAARNKALAALLGANGYANYTRICDAMAARVPARLANAWHLSILGVRPAARGRRLAHNLLELTLNRADQHGATCFLETFDRLSLPFYHRLGFVEERHYIEEITARPYWILARHVA
ncbi:GNAT family N-acetyltransferase [Paraburkholderia silviterrae]|uniref:GNAT family N-acetyltransferase n=1 Tax=Paraburkholderia silviterrae TaxID=2528715 RepID=A0A4R5M924_9BURK|nr:GNAT family N-acetyltransferase [Paraburkholderia silviterrae]TDG23126.1 GNAT family N-acetyltransferase [Paraburkholderia silviterrae]